MQYVPGELCWAMETLSVKCVCHEPLLSLPWEGTHVPKLVLLVLVGVELSQTEMMKADRFRQICGLLVGISNLDSVSCSVKLEEYLSFLDHTLAENELTKCDLATFGTSKIFDDEHNGRALISKTNGKVTDIDNDLLKQTRCLILSIHEHSQISDVLDVASSIQFTKSVGVMLEVQDLDHASKQINATIPFPLILKDRGKSMKSNNGSVMIMLL